MCGCTRSSRLTLAAEPPPLVLGARPDSEFRCPPRSSHRASMPEIISQRLLQSEFIVPCMFSPPLCGPGILLSSRSSRQNIMFPIRTRSQLTNLETPELIMQPTSPARSVTPYIYAPITTQATISYQQDSTSSENT